MTTRLAGPFPIPGIKMPTWLVRFDELGACTSPATAKALLEQLATGSYSDVLFYSHGWNTDFEAAVGQYGDFLKAFEDIVNAHPLPGFKPIFVGLTWPSVWWPSTEGPQMAGAGDPRVDAQRQTVAMEIGTRLAVDQREEFYGLADEVVLDRARAVRMATLVSMAIDAREPAAGDRGEGKPLLPEEILELARSLERAETGAIHGDDLDAIGVIGADPGAVAPDAAGGGFDPLGVLKLASLFQMKDRAGLVGSRGVNVLLRDILAGDRRVHVFGHSFGAKVMLSALAAPEKFPRKVNSLLLLQPAISHLAFADGALDGTGRAGGYRSVLERVHHPVLTTYSKLDFPLHEVFHWAVRRPSDPGELKIAAAGTSAGNPPNKYAALGGYGPRASGERDGIDPIPDVGEPYPDFGTATLVGLDGSSGRITSHGDVANPYTAWALRFLISRSMI